MLSVYNATASEKYFDTDEAKNKVTNGLYFFNETDFTIFLKAIQVNVKINQLGERICTM